MEKSNNIPYVNHLPPLGRDHFFVPLPPLGHKVKQAYYLPSCANQPLSEVRRLRGQKRHKHFHNLSLTGLEEIQLKTQNKLAINTLTQTDLTSDIDNNILSKLSSQSLPEEQNLVFTPKGFELEKTETNININNTISPEFSVDNNLAGNSKNKNKINLDQGLNTNNKESNFTTYNTPNIEGIAKEVYRLVRQKLDIDRERKGSSFSRRNSF